MIYEMDTEATFDSRLYHKTYRYSRKAARGEKADRTAPLPMSLLQLIQRLRILSIDRNVKINCIKKVSQSENPVTAIDETFLTVTK